MKNKKYSYSNTQVQLPDELRERFLIESNKLVHNKQLYSADQGREDNPHITLLYGIHSDKPPLELINLIETYPQFPILFGNISLFKGVDNNNPFDVVKVNIHCTDLHVLNQGVRDSVEYTSTYPDYVPHATIAYVKPDSCDYLDNNPVFKGLSFICDRILFSSSDGSKRELLLSRR